jgi:hypothetical protein
MAFAGTLKIEAAPGGAMVGAVAREVAWSVRALLVRVDAASVPTMGARSSIRVSLVRFRPWPPYPTR